MRTEAPINKVLQVPLQPVSEVIGFPQEEKEGFSIFVVERDPFYRRFMEHSLKKITRYVEFMPDGVTAVKRARIRRPDLVIYDPVSARVDNNTFCQWMGSNELFSSIPILIYSELNLEDEIGKEGNIQFLRKPFKEELLLETVNQLLVWGTRKEEG